MFTLKQIRQAHSRVKSGADFPAYITNIREQGVLKYETAVLNGNTRYFGQAGFSVETGPNYAFLEIAEATDAIQFVAELRAHQQGKTSFPEFCSACARTGIGKWEADLVEMTCSYYNLRSELVFIESIPATR